MALGSIKDLLAKRLHPQGRNSAIGWGHNSPIRILPKNIYFSFQGQFYEQVEDVAMGSPVSPIAANLFMKYFEQKGLSTVNHPQVMAQVCG